MRVSDKHTHTGTACTLRRRIMGTEDKRKEKAPSFSSFGRRLNHRVFRRTTDGERKRVKQSKRIWQEEWRRNKHIYHPDL